MGMEPKLFLHEKPVRALVTLSDTKRTWYAHLLSKEIDCSYAHLVKVLDQFEESGLVDFHKEGRVKLLSLTKKGEELAHDFETVLMRLSK